MSKLMENITNKVVSTTTHIDEKAKESLKGYSKINQSEIAEIQSAYKKYCTPIEQRYLPARFRNQEDNNNKVSELPRIFQTNTNHTLPVVYTTGFKPTFQDTESCKIIEKNNNRAEIRIYFKNIVKYAVEYLQHSRDYHKTENLYDPEILVFQEWIEFCQIASKIDDIANLKEIILARLRYTEIILT